MLARGIAVLGVDINAGELETLRKNGAETMVLDLAKPEDRTRLVQSSEGIDYLVNAAGLVRIKPIFEFTVQDWQDIFAINAEAIFFLCQGIGPRMRPGAPSSTSPRRRRGLLPPSRSRSTRRPKLRSSPSRGRSPMLSLHGTSELTLSAQGPSTLRCRKPYWKGLRRSAAQRPRR